MLGVNPCTAVEVPSSIRTIALSNLYCNTEVMEDQKDQETQTSRPISTPQKPSSNWLQIIILAVTMFLLGLVGGYLLFGPIHDISQFKSDKNSSITPSVVLATPTTTSTESSNWNTFRNQNYKFEMKYPGEAYEKLNSNGRSGFNNLSDNEKSFFIAFNYTFSSNSADSVIPPAGASSVGGFEYVLDVSIEKNTSKTLTSLVSDARKSYGNRPQFGAQDVIVDNTQAVRINDIAMDVPTDEVCFVKYNNLYCIQAKYYIDPKLYGNSEKYLIGNRAFSSVTKTFKFL